MSDPAKSEVAKRLLEKLDELNISDIDAVCIKLIVSKKSDKVDEDELEEEVD